MSYPLQFIASLLATVGFAYTFSCPKKTIFFIGLVGAIAWMILEVVKDYGGSIFLGNFLGAFSVGFLGEIFARKFLTPSSVFIIPGITTLCPGAGMYYTMYYFVENNRAMAFDKLLETLAIAGLLSFGILISSVGSRSLRSFKNRKYMKFDYLKRRKK